MSPPFPADPAPAPGGALNTGVPRLFPKSVPLTLTALSQDGRLPRHPTCPLGVVVPSLPSPRPVWLLLGSWATRPLDGPAEMSDGGRWLLN